MESFPFNRQHGSIPEDLVILILSRLQIESLARFRCVSKVWRSLISDPKFMFSSSQKHLRIAVKARGRVYSSSVYRSESKARRRVYSSGVYRSESNWFSFGSEEASSSDVILAKPFVCSDCTRRGQILGSCNGLLLVLHDTGDLYLWNPTTRQCAKMLSMAYEGFVYKFRYDAKCGLCYDSNYDDYKAVMVGRGLVTVVSFKKKSWATKTCSFDSEDYGVRWDSGPVVNEKLHWVLSPRRYASNNYFQTRVIYFDQLTEEFDELPMPLLTDNGKHITVVRGVGVLKGYLCMTRCVFERGDEVEHDYDSKYDSDYEVEHDYDPAFIEVLVMKEHGVGESWTSSFIIPNNDGVLVRSLRYYGSLVPLFLTKNGGILFLVERKKFVLYNPDEMSQRDIHIRFQPDHFSVGSYETSYVETSPVDCGLEGGWSSWTVERSDDWVVEPIVEPYVESLASPADYTPDEDWRVEVSDALHLLYRNTWSSWSQSWPASPYWVSENEDNKEDNSIEEHDDYVFMNGNGKNTERFFRKAKTQRYSLSRKKKKQKAQRRIKAKSKLTCRRKNQRKDKRREVEDFSKQVLDFSVN